MVRIMERLQEVIDLGRSVLPLQGPWVVRWAKAAYCSSQQQHHHHHRHLEDISSRPHTLLTAGATYAATTYVDAFKCQASGTV